MIGTYIHPDNLANKNIMMKLDIFAQYYQDLYISMDLDVRSIEEFLDNIELPTLEVDHVVSLEAPITKEEIRTVIKTLKPNTSPGPDMFTVEFYKTFEGTLFPYLHELFSECKNRKGLPATWALARLIILDRGTYLCRNHITPFLFLIQITKS